MSDILIQKIKMRATTRSTQIDMGEIPSNTIASPMTEQELSAAEKQLGFPLPDLLKKLCAAIGNGGYGPGYGLIGVMGGAKDDQGHDAIQLYNLYCQPDPDDPTWKWPEGLLPICNWGCAIYSCIDCMAENAPVIIFDPKMHDESWSQCFIRHKESLASWISAWAGGTNLWNDAYGDANAI
jgi:hypothetical protein